MNLSFRKNIGFNITPVLVSLLTGWILLVIPFKIIGYGFLPQDDALRHSAKAVSEKDWHDILVMRNDIKSIEHPGWAFILKTIHKMTGCDPYIAWFLFRDLAIRIIFHHTHILFTIPGSMAYLYYYNNGCNPKLYFPIFLRQALYICYGYFTYLVFCMAKTKRYQIPIKNQRIFNNPYSNIYLGIFSMVSFSFADCSAFNCA